MNPISQPLEFQAAAIRMAGYAVSNQMKIMQILTRSAMELPFVSVSALHASAAAPAPAAPSAKPAPKVKIEPGSISTVATI